MSDEQNLDDSAPEISKQVKTQTVLQINSSASDDFAAMSLDARTWYIYRKQSRLYKLLATVLGLDPDAVEIPWALQVELAGMLKDARENKDEASRRRERRATTFTNVIRYVLGGLALAGTLKLIELFATGSLLAPPGHH